MKWTTEVYIPPLDFNLNYDDSVAFAGSCFVENISSKMRDAGFRIDVNPFGIMYNPLSIAEGLYALLDKKVYKEEDLFEYQGLYHSFSHHSRFSGTDPQTCLMGINERIRHSSAFLERASVLFVTFGTSFVYRLKTDRRIVSNCHKLPGNLFFSLRLKPEEIVAVWEGVISGLIEKNPGLKIIFTVSPIRHLKDGAHENSLSKAGLLLAADELVKKYDFVHYFPSYEIMMDELRDYRFYADDMLHPSELAVEYIWQKFSGVFFGKEMKAAINEWSDIRKALNHRPFNPGSEEYFRFRKKTEQRVLAFRRKYNVSVEGVDGLPDFI